MSVSAYLTPREATPLPRGRRPSQPRDERIRFVAHILTGILSVGEAANAADVTPQTIANWRNRLLGDGEPDTEWLRDIARRN